MELPDEVLADILRRVHPPQEVTACRRVCKNWRSVVDGHRLVLPHLLPGAPHGVFVNYKARDGWSDAWSDIGYLSRGSPDGDIDSRLASTPPCSAVIDHCNGLLLCTSGDMCFVYNPATRRSEQVPAPPMAEDFRWGIDSPAYLVFDPAVSLHFEVFLLTEQLPEKPQPPIPAKPSQLTFNMARLFMGVSEDEDHEIDTDDDGKDWVMDPQEGEAQLNSHKEHCEVRDMMGLIEWPPPVYVVQVFSSVTGWWEARTFIRKGDAAGTVADMWVDPSLVHQLNWRWSPFLDWSPHLESVCGPRRRYTVYRKQFLYIQRCAGFVIRLSLLTGVYLVIQSPRAVSEYDWWTGPITYLSKSKKGVHYTATTEYLKFRVWVLNGEPEASRGTLPVWEMIYHADLKPSFKQLSLENPEEMDNSWILDHDKAVETKQGYQEWDSDGEEDKVCVKIIEEEEEEEEDGNVSMYSLDLLGYHPVKEIAFLGCRYHGSRSAYAYYPSTSKLEYLGHLYPKLGDPYTFSPRVRESYVYTPCRIDMLPDQKGVWTDLSYWLE